jgi:hypothetical protein
MISASVHARVIIWRTERREHGVHEQSRTHGTVNFARDPANAISVSTQPSPYRGYRFPPEIISYAVWLYHRFCLIFRDVEELLAQRGGTVSYEGGPVVSEVWSRVRQEAAASPRAFGRHVVHG